ncbi:MAG: hypothetical protein E7315_01380 [Clostridiales bacterium]|nr:hypothetical protein [Clostridiales bacterium]
MSWINEDAINNDVIINSRIRLARNVSGLFFPEKQTAEQSEAVLTRVMEVFDRGIPFLKDFTFTHMGKADKILVGRLLDKQLISGRLMDSKRPAGVFIDVAERVSVMVNEEDHIRIQGLWPGLALDKVYDYVMSLDDVIEENIPMAYDTQLGYLTASPTNLGTGMRAEVLVHLPALKREGLSKAFETLKQQGMIIRGLNGHTNSNSYTDPFYRIGNKYTLGVTEEEIKDTVTSAVQWISQLERDAQSKCIGNSRNELKDAVMRSVGSLAFSYTMPFDEFIGHFSNVRFGVSVGIINNVDYLSLNEILLHAQNGYIGNYYRVNSLEESDPNIIRARILREEFAPYAKEML